MGVPELHLNLEEKIFEALETYSNVHRGSGHFSMATTELFDAAREIVLDHFGLDKSSHVVIFTTPLGAATIYNSIKSGNYRVLSSHDLGLPIGVRAIAVKKDDLPSGSPEIAGGGTTRLISRNWVLWAKGPDKFEAGTPAIINIIAFACALQQKEQFANAFYKDKNSPAPSVSEIFYDDEFKDYHGKDLMEKLRQVMIGRNIAVQTVEGNKPFINLDYAASTPTFLPVWNAYISTLKLTSGLHEELISEAKAICSSFLNAPSSSYEIIFTSNTTEAINLAAKNLSHFEDKYSEPVILNTLLEHNSNDLPWRGLKGFSHIRLSINEEGFINLKELETLLAEYNKEKIHGRKSIRLVAVSGFSNVLGTMNDLDEISRIVHSYGAQLLVDGAQMVAHRKTDLESTGIDYFAFSAHKAYAPFGTGVLVMKKELMHFSPEEFKLIKASGEENVAGIAALGKSLELLQRIGFDVIMEEERALTALALKKMVTIPGIKIYGISDPEADHFRFKGGVIAFSLKKMMADRIAKKLALEGGIGIRFGCHCAHILVKHILNFKPFLERLQRMIITVFPKLQLPGVARVSFGIGNTVEEVEEFTRVLKVISKQNPTLTKEQQQSEHQMSRFIQVKINTIYPLKS